MYSDREREERYGRLRARKNKLEKQHDILGWVVMGTVGLGAVISIFSGVLYGVFVDASQFFYTLFELAEAGAVIYAVYKRDWRITLGVLIGYILLTAIQVGAFDGHFSIVDLVVVLLGVELYIDRQWFKLSQEEGFPHFDITYAEREKRQQIQEELMRNRALQAGVRVASTEQTSGMGDLLDADSDAPVLAPHLQARHDRSRLYAAPGTQMPDAFDAGKMGMLEEIGAPAPEAPPQNTEMDEL